MWHWKCHFRKWQRTSFSSATFSSRWMFEVLRLIPADNPDALWEKFHLQHGEGHIKLHIWSERRVSLHSSGEKRAWAFVAVLNMQRQQRCGCRAGLHLVGFERPKMWLDEALLASSEGYKNKKTKTRTHRSVHTHTQFLHPVFVVQPLKGLEWTSNRWRMSNCSTRLKVKM